VNLPAVRICANNDARSEDHAEPLLARPIDGFSAASYVEVLGAECDGYLATVSVELILDKFTKNVGGCVADYDLLDNT
jgi:hypothetical protein